jgi:hypothetical protein
MTQRHMRSGRGVLALVPTEPRHRAPDERVLFCGHCGKRPEQEADSRVCRSCGLGLLLETSAQAAPAEGGAFLVIDSAMAVCAVSAAAEQLLATSETDAVNHHLTELLVPADAEAQGPTNLAVAVTWAARGAGEIRRTFVRPAKTFGVRLKASIASCNSPDAALIVLD